MTIRNELTGDILAAVILRENRARHDLNRLKDLLFTVHSTLQQMSYDHEKRRRHYPMPSIEPVKSE